MAQAKKTPAKPIQDVAHPNTSAADATAKPVLITNRPIMTDPMVKASGGNDLSEDDTVQTEKEPAKLKHTITVEPLSAPEIPGAKAVEEIKDEPKEDDKGKDQPKEADADDVSKEEPVKETSTELPEKSEEKPNVEPSAETPEKDEEKSDGTEKTESEDEAEEKPSKDVTEKTAPEIDEAEKKKQAEHDLAISSLVESKKYYLPINTIEKRRSKNHIVLGILLSLILIVAWADVALDSGIIKLQSSLPHTHFFSNASTTIPTPTAPAAPSVSFSKYTFAASKLNIKYPSKWVVASTGSVNNDQVLITPPANTSGTSLISGSIKVNYTSNSLTSSSGNYTVKSVAYKQLPKTTANPVYLRDIVYLNQADSSINVSSSLTNSKTTKLGDSLSSLTNNFVINNTPVDSFVITVQKTTAGVNGFKNAALAHSYMSSATYLQARSILFSLSN